MIYLDNAATTRVNNFVFLEAEPYFRDEYGNPSSLHKMGTKAKEAIETARKQVADSINAKPEQIFFFSSATEANNFVLSNYYSGCSPYEHSSVFKNAQDKHPSLYSHMLVNNETGDIFDIKELCRIAHDNEVDFHTDATQALGKMIIDVKDLDVDYLTFSGHKIHGMKGCAVLYIKVPEICRNRKKMMLGGNQEKGFHPGTENVPAIVAMGQACKIFNYRNLDEIVKIQMEDLNHSCIEKFIASGIDFALNGISDKQVPSILNISFKDVDGETLQYMLSQKGVCVSTSSACSSGKKKSRVLEAMNVPDDYIYGAIRISFSYDELKYWYSNYFNKVMKAIDIIISTVEELKAYG